MKLKLLILFAFIAVTNAFAQTTDSESLRADASITVYPDGPANFVSGEVAIFGVTFNVQITLTPGGDGVYIGSTATRRSGVGNNASSTGTNTPSTIEGDENESVTVSSIQIINFNAGTTTYSISDLADLHFESFTIRLANGADDNPRITVNGTNPGTFDLGQLAGGTEVLPVGVAFTNLAGTSITVGDPDNVTSLEIATATTSASNVFQFLGFAVSYTFTPTDWTGTTGAVWSDATNWTNGVPLSNSDVVVPSGLTNQPVIGSTTQAVTDNLTVDPASTLTVESGGSLIVNGTSNGDVTYNRSLGTANWYLVSSPVSGEIMTDMRANNTFANGTGGSRIGFAPYTTTDDTWSYFTTSSTDALVNGAGYSAKLNASGDISFTGSINTVDVDASVSFAANGFNLVGNPYTSHINSKTFLDANSNLDQTQLWVWNQSIGVDGSYEVKTNANEFILGPAQGFFVKANSGTQVTFNESNQIGTGGTFQKSAKTEVKLSITNGQSNRFAKIYYLDNATKGFDTGYEGEVFGGITNSLDVFTNLVEENQGKKYQVQSLPNSDYENIIVPVGVKAAAGKEITFSVESLNLPEGIKVILEDRVKNVFTNLDEGDYEISLTEAADGVGRFYLHTSSKSALSVDDNLALNSISIFKTNASTLRIAGLQQGNATIKLYNILGKQVLNSAFFTSGVKDVALPKLATGVYVVQLQTVTGKLSKKIILE
jgi:hypothetical protein